MERTDDMQMEQQMQMRAGQTVKCPHCGALNEPEAMFCASCGQPIFVRLVAIIYGKIPALSVVPTYQETRLSARNVAVLEVVLFVLYAIH